MNVCAGTMGVCIAPCSLPGAAPMFQLGPHDMELGMGVYCIFYYSTHTYTYSRTAPSRRQSASSMGALMGVEPNSGSVDFAASV